MQYFDIIIRLFEEGKQMQDIIDYYGLTEIDANRMTLNHFLYKHPLENKHTYILGYRELAS